MTAASERHRDRLAQGAAAVMSPSAAARLLPIDDREALSWLQDRGLVRQLLGRPVVVWFDVLEAIRGADEEPRRQEKQRPRAMPRMKL